MPPKYVPVAWKKQKEIMEKLGYPVSDQPDTDNNKQVYNMYVDTNGNLIVETDE